MKLILSTDDGDVLLSFVIPDDVADTVDDLEFLIETYLPVIIEE